MKGTYMGTYIPSPPAGSELASVLRQWRRSCTSVRVSAPGSIR